MMRSLYAGAGWFLWVPSNLRYFMTVWNTWHVLCFTGGRAGRCILSHLYLYGWSASCSGISGSIHPLPHAAADHRAGSECSIFWCLMCQASQEVKSVAHSWFQALWIRRWSGRVRISCCFLQTTMVKIGKPCQAGLAWLCKVRVEQQQDSCAACRETGSRAWQS